MESGIAAAAGQELQLLQWWWGKASSLHGQLCTGKGNFHPLPGLDGEIFVVLVCGTFFIGNLWQAD